MSNLVDHARYELELIGEEPETITGLLKVLQAFADMGHSGMSATITIQMLDQLFQFKNLTPLTDNPDGWVQHAEDLGGMWQSTRDYEAFSTDGGKTYEILSDKRGPDGKKPVHISASRKDW